MRPAGRTRCFAQEAAPDHAPRGEAAGARVHARPEAAGSAGRQEAVAHEEAEASANAEQERRQIISRIRQMEAMRTLLAQNGTNVDALDQALKILRLRLAKFPPGEPDVIDLNAGNVVVESRIDGDFEGWEDEAVFKLENGQMWQQTDFRFRYTYKFRPKVVIYKSGGRYFMAVENFKDEVEVEIAMQWNDSYSESIFTYCNNINTIEGGTHVTGFRQALTRVFKSYGDKEGLFEKAKVEVEGDDFREGLTAIISVKVAEPQFEGQTKTKLGNREVVSPVSQAVSEMLENYLEENPNDAKTIVQKIILAAQARHAAKKRSDQTESSAD